MGESGTKLPPGDARLMARCGFEGPGDTRDTNDSSFAVFFGDRKDWDNDSDGVGDGVGDDVGDGDGVPWWVFLLHPQPGIWESACGVI